MQITIIGVGLIGGSFAMALKKRRLAGRVIGCDRAAVVERARQMGAIDDGIQQPEAAISDSQTVLLATPVGAIIDMIERVGPLLSPDVLLTDVGSTKAEIVAKARAVFGGEAGNRFLGGHPMAGKEHGGVESADAELFAGAGWALTPVTAAGAGQPPAMVEQFIGLLEGVGARPIFMAPALHDRLCAWVSHLPQMLATALAAEVAEEFHDTPDLLSMGGRSLREMTRLAQSPYSVWRDIALTNSSNIEEVLLRLEQRLAHIRENLRTRELEAEFQRARKIGAP